MVNGSKPQNAKQAARMRQGMTRGETHALMKQSLSVMINAMNELEGRIQELESRLTGEKRSASGLVLPASLDTERVQ